MNVSVFIQNEAGSRQKNYHDEKTLTWQRAVTVSSAYPFPYGFIVGTTAEDRCNVDCFVLTDHAFKTGEIVDCQVVGLMEQFEDGQQDHNVLVVPLGRRLVIDGEHRARLSRFVLTVFEHVPGKHIEVGRYLDARTAEAHVLARLDG